MNAVDLVDALTGYDPRTAHLDDTILFPDGRTQAMYAPDEEVDPGDTPWTLSRPHEHASNGGWSMRTVDIPEGCTLLTRGGKPVMPLGMALDLLLDIARDPIRARELAAALGRPIDEVRAELRRKQQAGTVRSAARRWSLVKPRRIRRRNAA
ncbi:hypothetical protein [Parafrankia sp. EUN1f]|uniref:hypothetical protein n=1 Tax=Parafrankia sp. EUN1f TaxID=102897 RepID=UPI0001C47565|nr:hypothetical protein [Parafrankia sp. EUN1f]EFC79303.1 hypothetical protein FrEUN1fDRAFT_7578 [Parafrankia sp. EUN1f]